VSGGVSAETDLRAPRDIGNLITLLGLAQNLAHDASSTTPKSLVLRAQTRKTYRAVLSEPKLIIPSEAEGSTKCSPEQGPAPPGTSTEPNESGAVLVDNPQTGQKRARNDEADADVDAGPSLSTNEPGQGKRKKKKNKNK